MDEHDIRAIRGELRKIRDGIEVLVMLGAVALVIGIGFSGYLWPKPTGYWAVGVYLLAFIVAGGFVKGIRER